MNRITITIVALSISTVAHAQTPTNYQPAIDWLLDSKPFNARVVRDTEQSQIVLENGLIRRTIRLSPGSATVGFDNLMTDNPIIRAGRPAAGARSARTH